MSSKGNENGEKSTLRSEEGKTEEQKNQGGRNKVSVKGAGGEGGGTVSRNETRR